MPCLLAWWGLRAVLMITVFWKQLGKVPRERANMEGKSLSMTFDSLPVANFYSCRNNRMYTFPSKSRRKFQYWWNTLREIGDSIFMEANTGLATKCLDFSIRCYGKTWMKFVANPVSPGWHIIRSRSSVLNESRQSLPQIMKYTDLAHMVIAMPTWKADHYQIYIAF